MKPILGGSRYASITATLALVVALGGTSYAAVNLPKNSVGSKQIAKAAVKSSDVKNDGLTGKDIKESSLSTVPSATSADQLGGKTLRGLSQWVHVETDGDIIAQSGGITVTDLAAPGRYRVNFPTDVSACGLNANVSAASPQADLGTFDPGMAMVVRSSTGPNAVQVGTADVAAGGTYEDKPFILTVQC
ncbi:hypothetical protein [Nocardioides sp.]|uniref:hypothetical protein n=1 Tax=Nocardioides sp. TaxID=35761 RepID=UPI001A34849B|nr:hypothetical protein [Nocardioides sp.]MBJ7358000.1 hypothetical protein [Nocardioides sp.]